MGNKHEKDDGSKICVHFSGIDEKAMRGEYEENTGMLFDLHAEHTYLLDRLCAAFRVPPEYLGIRVWTVEIPKREESFELRPMPIVEIAQFPCGRLWLSFVEIDGRELLPPPYQKSIEARYRCHFPTAVWVRDRELFQTESSRPDVRVEVVEHLNVASRLFVESVQAARMQSVQDFLCKETPCAWTVSREGDHVLFEADHEDGKVYNLPESLFWAMSHGEIAEWARLETSPHVGYVRIRVRPELDTYRLLDPSGNEFFTVPEPFNS